MGLSTALSSALSGLRTTQSGLALVASNVANAETPGYTRKSQSLSAVLNGSVGGGVRQTDVTRAVDTYLQRQLRTESAGLSYADVNAGYLDRLQRLFGTPGSSSSLDSLINGFVGALDQLVTSPEQSAAKTSVLNNAQVLTQSLSSISGDIQAMRAEADDALRSGADRANQLLQQLAGVSSKIVGGTGSADLLDRRDVILGELGQLMDVHVVENGRDLSVFTTGGVPLYSNGIASTLRFDKPTPVNAQTQYSTNPAERTIGTIMVVSPSGAQTDLLAGGVRSGSLKAYAELRDETLVQAQAQLDELASQLAVALGTKTVAGTAATSGAQQGFAVDLADLKAGNTFTLTTQRTPGGASQTVTFVRVDRPDTLPLDNAVTADPNDRVVGVDFSGASGSVAAQIQAALGGAFTVSGTGTSIQILDDGAAGTTDVTGLSARASATGLQDGLELPFFIDAGAGGIYTGSLDGVAQKTGIAGRLRVNPALLANPAALVSYGPGVSTSDPARPTWLRDALESVGVRFDPATGIGGAASPYTGSIAGFAREMISGQAQKAEFAERVLEGQQIVVTSLQDRFAESSGVNVDEEMSKLLQLQTAYSANARVVTAVKEMIDALLRM